MESPSPACAPVSLESMGGTNGGCSLTPTPMGTGAPGTASEALSGGLRNDERQVDVFAATVDKH